MLVIDTQQMYVNYKLQWMIFFIVNSNPEFMSAVQATLAGVLNPTPCHLLHKQTETLPRTTAHLSVTSFICKASNTTSNHYSHMYVAVSFTTRGSDASGNTVPFSEDTFKKAAALVQEIHDTYPNSTLCHCFLSNEECAKYGYSTAVPDLFTQVWGEENIKRFYDWTKEDYGRTAYAEFMKANNGTHFFLGDLTGGVKAEFDKVQAMGIAHKHLVYDEPKDAGEAISTGVTDAGAQDAAELV